jgi:acetyltransferase-like isoleucine patch superfamily enzyme
VLGDFASLAPNVATGGGCEIGDFTALSIGTVLTHGRTIGHHTVIGAGSVVVRDIPELVVAYGSPARIVRDRSPGDPYL